MSFLRHQYSFYIFGSCRKELNRAQLAYRANSFNSHRVFTQEPLEEYDKHLKGNNLIKQNGLWYSVYFFLAGLERIKRIKITSSRINTIILQRYKRGLMAYA